MQFRRAISVFAVFAATALAPALAAQTFDLVASGRQIVALDGLMRFQPGDDPKLRWANPTFDDSSWPLIRGDQGWSSQGYPHLTGLAWYRFKILIPDRTPLLALWVPSINTSFQIYADGRLIGEFGGMPPHPRALGGHNFVFAIPHDLIHPGHSLTIALRVWDWSWEILETGGLQGAMRLGDAGLIHEWQTHQYLQTFWQLTQSNIIAVVCLLAGLGSFVLFFLRPSDRGYLWFGIWELFTVLYQLSSDYESFISHDISRSELFFGFIILVLDLSMLTFIRHFLGIGRTRLYWATLVFGVLDPLLYIPAALRWISYPSFCAGQAVFMTLLAICACAMLLKVPKGSPADMRALALPMALFAGNLIALFIGIVLAANGASWVGPYLMFVSQIVSWPFPIGSFQICNLAIQLTMFAILLFRFARTRRDEERFKNELEAARIVQNVLVPAEIPSIPGFSIASVYKPAGQVGGDFFQIIPTDGGGALVAIGDVSGKGMPAAMTVSLLVGTLRTLAHYTQRPSEILAAMNQRMLARSAGGFTTCLVLTLAADGTLTVANAGHIAPYLDGRELLISNGLPLGLSADADYTESTFCVSESGQLTLMTDGVAEARAKNGELLGFDRVADLSIGSAESIADAAQTFGQQDDITVVTLKRVPLPASVPVRSAATAPEIVPAPEPI